MATTNKFGYTILKPLLRNFGLMRRCRVLLEYPWSTRVISRVLHSLCYTELNYLFYKIITNKLKLRKVAARWVPHHLSDEQKACRQKIAEEFPKLKKTLQGKCFATIEEASTEVTHVIRQLNGEGLEYRICQNVGKLS